MWPNDAISIYLGQKYLMSIFFEGWDKVPQSIKDDMWKQMKENNHRHTI